MQVKRAQTQTLLLFINVHQDVYGSITMEINMTSPAHFGPKITYRVFHVRNIFTISPILSKGWTRKVGEMLLSWKVRHACQQIYLFANWISIRHTLKLIHAFHGPCDNCVRSRVIWRLLDVLSALVTEKLGTNVSVFHNFPVKFSLKYFTTCN